MRGWTPFSGMAARSRDARLWARHPNPQDRWVMGVCVEREGRFPYATTFAAAGAMRPALELYRACDRDGEDNRAALKKSGRLAMPVLALGGESSFFVPIAKEMLGEVAKHVTVAGIPHSGHWVAEENPEALVKELLRFCRGGKGWS